MQLSADFNTLTDDSLHDIAQGIEQHLYALHAALGEYKVYRERFQQIGMALRVKGDLFEDVVSGEIDIPTLCSMNNSELATADRRAKDKKIAQQCMERCVKRLGRTQSGLVMKCSRCHKVRCLTFVKDRR